MARRRGTAFTLLSALAVLLALPASAPAKSKPITGKLSKRGYTVIALDAQGRAASVVAKKGKFKLRPPAKKVTLQLRAPNGTYAGPIVVVGDDNDAKAKKSKKKKKKSKRAIVGVKAGASLGKVKVKAGFALAKGVAKTSLDTKRTATAKKGVPIGAGNFGRVTVAKLKGPSADRDLDGVPDVIDIDDDGDLILDDVDRNSAGGARAAQEGSSFADSFTQLNLTGSVFPDGPEPVNANAPGISDAQIEAALRGAGKLNAGVGLPSPELDCGGLTYCSAGGTGRLSTFEPFDLNPNAPPFPACCDPDGDGLGSLGTGFGGATGQINLLHGASSDQIRTGDQLLMKGGQGEGTTTLKSVFATPPALASYTDEAGVTHPISYPIAHGTSFPVKDGTDPGSDISVRLTLWRSQRRAIPQELSGGTGKWIDMGGLFHYAEAINTSCPQSSYSAADPILDPSQGPFGSVGGPGGPTYLFIDKAPDQRANPGNTFSYTLNLTQCYAAAGLTTFGEFELRFNARLPEDPRFGATSGYTFQNQP